VLETVLGLSFIAVCLYVVASARRLAEKWERQGHEPGRFTLFRSARPKASEMRLRAVIVGSICIVIGSLSVLSVFR
jgi:hypothetical protein